MGAADAIGGAGEAHAPGAVDFAGDGLTDGGLARATCARSWRAGEGRGLLVGPVAPSVGAHEHAAVMNAHESLVD